MGKYDDIINLPHYKPKNHKRMSMYARAAQFAPFAALTGYDDVIHETARLTDEQVELEEHDNNRLNRKFAELTDAMEEHPKITVTYFKPDELKAGGAYVSITGTLKKVDTYEQLMIFDDGNEIPIAHIVDLQF